MTGVELIEAERKRQIEAEGWTPEHDDQHINGELAAAAGCYAFPGHTGNTYNGFPIMWPYDWNKSWWKPTPDNRVRELVKAGALIAAEIDRLLRIEAKR